jgi:branched-subunit amino acid aminotransferase/4-amino-4-deoxychorismate lyase
MVIMNDPAVLRVEIDGRTPSVERLRAVALAGYGHFTAMQVRNHRVRGLDLHLKRLDRANREVFGADLDGDRVRDHIRHALGENTPDASVRVYVQWPDGDQAPSVTVIVRRPVAVSGTALRLQSVPYQRSVAHIKHIGDFGQSYYGRLAQRNGFDEALLTGPDGIISEGAITNIGFFDGTTIVWPSAPLLQGITMQLLQARLPGHGLPSRRSPVRLADVESFAGVFVTNSRGIAPVKQVDNRALPVDTLLMQRLTEAYESAPWDQI